MRIRVTNTSGATGSIDPITDITLVDSQQQTLTPDVNATGSYGNTPVPQCKQADSTATLVPNATATFHLCYDLANAKDLPVRLLFGNGAEVPFR